MHGPVCTLPDLPGAIKPAVGFPDANGIYLSRSDFAEIASYVMQLRDWIEAARPCLEGKQ